MKMRPVGAEVFHVERRTDGQTDGHIRRNKYWLFAILWTRL